MQHPALFGRRTSWKIAAAGFSVLIALAGFYARDGRIPHPFQSTATVHTHTASCQGEPELPPLLEVVASKTDPDQLKVRVLPGLDAMARLDVQSNVQTTWSGNGLRGRLALQRGAAPQSFTLNVGPSHSKTPRVVRVGLVIEDEEGAPSITVHREVTLGASPEAASAQEAQPAIMGTTAGGEAVQSRVAAGAPAPVIEEAVR